MVNSELTYDLIAHQWTVPVNLLFSQVFKVGDQPFSIQVGPRYYVETPANGPRWGARFQSDRFISRTLIERRN